MPIHNSEIADIFNKMADLLEIKGANRFRVGAYRNAARTIGEQSESVARMLDEGKDLSELSGIGDDLAGKIETIVKTGKLPMLEDLEKEVPPELSKLLDIKGMGPKRVHQLYEQLDIENIDDLKEALENNKIRDLEGFGEKTEEDIREGLDWLEKEEQKRIKIAVAEEFAESLREYLKNVEGVDKIEIAGSYRRRKQTVGDLDILVTCDDNEKVMKAFVNYDDVKKVLLQGDTKSTVMLKNNLQIDLRVVEPEQYGSALMYFTGSRDHNIALRKRGQKRDLKINEYGVFNEDEERVAGETEEEIYDLLDLSYIEPELRENRGEIEAAENGNLPKLITLDDIRGDLHAHTKRTDGHYSLEEMIQAAVDRGYEYFAITDHSKSNTVANGFDKDRLQQEIEDIEKLRDQFDSIQILKGIELDILEDGSLDLPDDILEKLDVVVCSIHSKFGLSRDKQTERVIKAMDNPNFHIFGHPTGRLLQEREPYDIDMEKIMNAAKEKGCFLELNAHRDRLDLDDINCKMAKEKGVLVAISTDAHSKANLDDMKLGIGQARRGWLSPEDVLNTRSWEEVKKLLKRK